MRVFLFLSSILINRFSTHNFQSSYITAEGSARTESTGGEAASKEGFGNPTRSRSILGAESVGSKSTGAVRRGTSETTAT